MTGNLDSLNGEDGPPARFTRGATHHPRSALRRPCRSVHLDGRVVEEMASRMRGPAGEPHHGDRAMSDALALHET
jgi:hypothetical protein